MRFRLTIFDNIEMQEVKNITIDEISSFKIACRIAEMHQDDVADDYPDTTIQLERLDDA